MTQYSPTVIKGLRKRCGSTNPTEKGKAWEDFADYYLGKVPGLRLEDRDVRNFAQSEEVDLAYWNEKSKKGFYFIESHTLLVECKNYSKPMGAAEVSAFKSKLEHRNEKYGVIISMFGISGSGEDMSAANHAVGLALHAGYRLLVFTSKDLATCATSENVVKLTKKKLCGLAVRGTSVIELDVEEPAQRAAKRESKVRN